LVLSEDVENPVITDFCIVVCCENIAQQLETWRNTHQELTTRHLLTRVFKRDAVEGGEACEKVANTKGTGKAMNEEDVLFVVSSLKKLRVDQADRNTLILDPLCSSVEDVAKQCKLW
jgi:hypothetical protein